MGLKYIPWKLKKERKSQKFKTSTKSSINVTFLVLKKKLPE
jgi:hypothetical protein